jgi:hypothetical protein
MLIQKYFYTRQELRKLLQQPRVKRGHTYTLSHPSVRSISIILRCLSEVVGEFGLNELQREVPKQYVKALTDTDDGIETDTNKVTAIKYLATSGKVSFRAIPLIQYILDNSNFAYLDGRQNLVDWLKTPVHQQCLCSTYRALLGKSPIQALPVDVESQDFSISLDGTVNIFAVAV